MSPRRTKLVCGGLFVLATGLLFCGFQWNAFGVAEAGWFRYHQTDSEGMIMARLAISREKGFFSYAGLPMTLDSEEDIGLQYDAYLYNRPYESCWEYRSQIGGEGMFFALLDRAIPISNAAKLDLFHALTSLLTAAVLAAIIVWLYLEFGLPAAALALASSVAAPWMTVFGRNLWWSLWSFYLPMAAVMFVLRRGMGILPMNEFKKDHGRDARETHGRDAHATKADLWRLGAVVFATVLVKCLFTGYEYITTALVMAVVPLGYYAFARKMPWRTIWRASLALATGMAAAILVSLAVLSVQIADVTGDTWGGPRHFLYSLNKRAYASEETVAKEFVTGRHAAPQVVAAHQAGTWSVLETYLDGPWSDKLPQAVGPDVPRWPVRYWHVIALFAAAGVGLWLLGRRRGNRDRHLQKASEREPISAVGTLAAGDSRAKDRGLTVAFILALLAPLSWLVIFKAHSFIHIQMNFITWHMPMTLFGFALVGAVLGRVWAICMPRQR